MSLSTGDYRPRDAEHAMLYRVIDEHLDAFLETARRHADGAALPAFVEQEFRDFLTCGVLAHGFARLRCTGCALERLVPFSCKGRGFCPSCGGRRMTECAARLVDEVLPQVPVRQWVLSVPYRLRYLLAWDHALARAVLGVYVRVLLGFQRERAHPLRNPRWTIGIGDGDSALRGRTQSERPLPHAPVRRRLLRRSREWCARFPAVAAADGRGGRRRAGANRRSRAAAAQAPRARSRRRGHGPGRSGGRRISRARRHQPRLDPGAHRTRSARGGAGVARRGRFGRALGALDGAAARPPRGLRSARQRRRCTGAGGRRVSPGTNFTRSSPRRGRWERLPIPGTATRCSWFNQLDHVSIGHGVSLLCWRSGGANTPTIRRLLPVSPSPTSAHSSTPIPPDAPRTRSGPATRLQHR